MERIGLDRVDLAGRPPPGDELVGDSKDEATERRHQHGENGIEPRERRQALAERQLEKQAVQEVNASAHGRDDKPGEGPGNGGQQNQSRLPRADKRAYPVRYLELAQRLAQAAP